MDNYYDTVMGFFPTVWNFALDVFQRFYTSKWMMLFVSMFAAWIAYKYILSPLIGSAGRSDSVKPKKGSAKK